MVSARVHQNELTATGVRQFLGYAFGRRCRVRRRTAVMKIFGDAVTREGDAHIMCVIVDGLSHWTT